MSGTVPRCQVVPLPDDQVSLRVDGRERLRWHHGHRYPRPFFYPLIGPSGAVLTRIGHPGAPNHDHHRSIWFAHHKVLGIDFWGDNTAARIRQTSWLVYEDGGDACRMAVKLGWYDGHDPQPLLQQELIASLLPADDGETLIELQSRFEPLSETLEFGMTNFGFLAVRVAAGISAHFGGGRLTGDDGRRGEAELFGDKSKWMDYSGPVRPAVDVQDGNDDVTEGITYFDHASNPGYPSRWHVREDGWMGASVCRQGPVSTDSSSPLTLRYLLHAHRGNVDPAAAAALSERFNSWKPWRVTRSTRPHRQFEMSRVP